MTALLSLRFSVVEPLSLLAMAYLAYLSAELVHFSGIIACVGCGVVQAHYAMKNISKHSYITIKYFITMARWDDTRDALLKIVQRVTALCYARWKVMP